MKSENSETRALFFLRYTKGKIIIYVIFFWLLRVELMINPSNGKATFVQSTRMQSFFKKPFKPSHVGIHLITLAEYSQMRTHVLWFQSFFQFFILHHFVLAKFDTSSIKVNRYTSPRPQHYSPSSGS